MTAPRQEPERSFSPYATAAFFLRNARWIVGISAAFVVIAVVATVFGRREYEAVSEFMPQTRQPDAGNLTGLAAQFGFSVAGMGTNESVDFYAELVRSKDLLTEAVTTTYRFPASTEPDADTLSGTLIELLEIEAETEEERLWAAVQELNDRVAVSPNIKANVVNVRTRTPWRALSVQLNRRIIDLVNVFNLEKRQSQARAERDFVGRRLAEARSELREAESELQRFLEENRAGSSPRVRFEEGRLQRAVDLRQQVVNTLVQSHEQARIDEIRDTPVITVTDSPEGSSHPVGNSLLLNVLLAGFAGLVVASCAVFLREYLARERRENPSDYGAFERQKSWILGRWRRRRGAAPGHAAAAPSEDAPERRTSVASSEIPV